MTYDTEELPETLLREEVLDLITGEIPRQYIADNFGKYCLPWAIGRLMCRYELMKRILNVSGSIIECGIGSGAGLIGWHHLSKLLEPLNRRRIVYGFDTFEGFPNVSPKDGPKAKIGDQTRPVYDDIIRCIVMAEANNIMMEHTGVNWLRPKTFFRTHLWPQIVPIDGDFMVTGQEFLKMNPHLMVALLFLDFDLYEPTKKAIDLFLPRMPKGAVIVFDELDHPDWPGETLALIEAIGIWRLRIERFSWEPTLGYAVLE